MLPWKQHIITQSKFLFRGIPCISSLLLLLFSLQTKTLQQLCFYINADISEKEYSEGRTFEYNFHIFFKKITLPKSCNDLVFNHLQQFCFPASCSGFFNKVLKFCLSWALIRIPPTSLKIVLILYYCPFGLVQLSFVS